MYDAVVERADDALKNEGKSSRACLLSSGPRLPSSARHCHIPSVVVHRYVREAAARTEQNSLFSLPVEGNCWTRKKEEEEEEEEEEQGCEYDATMNLRGARCVFIVDIICYAVKCVLRLFSCFYSKTRGTASSFITERKRTASKSNTTDSASEGTHTCFHARYTNQRLVDSDNCRASIMDAQSSSLFGIEKRLRRRKSSSPSNGVGGSL